MNNINEQDNRPRIRTFKCEACSRGIHCYHTTITDESAGHKTAIQRCPHTDAKEDSNNE